MEHVNNFLKSTAAKVVAFIIAVTFFGIAHADPVYGPLSDHGTQPQPDVIKADGCALTLSYPPHKFDGSKPRNPRPVQDVDRRTITIFIKQTVYAAIVGDSKMILENSQDRYALKIHPSRAQTATHWLGICVSSGTYSPRNPTIDFLTAETSRY